MPIRLAGVSGVMVLCIATSDDTGGVGCRCTGSAVEIYKFSRLEDVI